jgi:hypothetical protein
MKPLISKSFKWGKKGAKEEVEEDDPTNVQCKPIQNCHKESPLHNKYILIKNKNKNKNR